MSKQEKLNNQKKIFEVFEELKKPEFRKRGISKAESNKLTKLICRYQKENNKYNVTAERAMGNIIKYHRDSVVLIRKPKLDQE